MESSSAGSIYVKLSYLNLSLVAKSDVDDCEFMHKTLQSRRKIICTVAVKQSKSAHSLSISISFRRVHNFPHCCEILLWKVRIHEKKQKILVVMYIFDHKGQLSLFVSFFLLITFLHHCSAGHLDECYQKFCADHFSSSVFPQDTRLMRMLLLLRLAPERGCN